MLTNCPHCFTRVVPKDDGTCPACQRDVNDPLGADPDRATLRVSQGDELPAVCCECGEYADRYVAVCISSNWGRDRPSRWVQALHLLIWWPVSLYLWLCFLLYGIHETSTVQVKMPLCHRCAAPGAQFRVTYVDFSNVRMTVVVHKNLRDAVVAREDEGCGGVATA